MSQETAANGGDFPHSAVGAAYVRVWEHDASTAVSGMPEVANATLERQRWLVNGTTYGQLSYLPKAFFICV
jgi:hypothetical protein